MRWLVLFLLLCGAAQAQPIGGGGASQIIPGTNLSVGNVTAAGGTTARTEAIRANDPGFSVLEMGAKCDGSTDDTTAINNALSSGNKNVTIPQNAICYSASGIVVPSGVKLKGLSFTPSATPSGSEILCNSSVTACVTVNGGSLESLVVASNASGSLTGAGVYVNDSSNVTLQKVYVTQFASSYGWHSAGNADGGKMLETYSGNVSDAHIIMDGWHNLRIENSNFGGNVAATAFIRIIGSTANPDTLTVVNSQFNQGNNQPVSYFMQFANCTLSCSGTGSTIFSIHDSHIETIGTAFISSDSTWNEIQSLILTGNTFFASSNGPQPFFSINSGTQLNNIKIVGNDIQSSSFNLSTTSQYNGVVISDNSISSPVSITSGNSGSTLVLSNNYLYGGLSLSGAWASLSVSGGSLLSGSLTNSATGSVTIAIPGKPFYISDNGTLGGTLAIGGNITTPLVINAGTSSSSTLTLTNTGSNGSGIQINGNGGSNPNKLLRVQSGSLQIVNSGQSATLFSMDDSGNSFFLNGYVSPQKGIISQGTKFTTSGCSISATTGGANAGTMTSGISGTCTPVVTMAGATGSTASNGWSCWMNNLSHPGTTNIMQQSASNTTTATFTGTTVSGDVLNFGCMGY